jgi:hypothetical protein
VIGRGDFMEIEHIHELLENMETGMMLKLNQHISTSLRKKGIKLREFRWHEVEAS